MMQVNLSEWIGQHIYMTGGFEKEVAEIIYNRLKPGDVFVDIGANMGFFSLLASKMVGPSGHIYAFEPSPETSRIFANNVKINGLKNIDARQFALSQSSGKVRFYEGPERNKGLSSFRKVEDASSCYYVETHAFDQLDLKKEKIKIVKIDVEGAEELVLDGMVEFLTGYHPDLVLEISKDFLLDNDCSVASLKKKLEGFGYSLYEFTEDGLRPLSEHVSTWDKQFNVFCSVSRL